MAYKFQLGAAVLSGSVTAAGDITVSTTDGDGTAFVIGNASMSEEDLEKLDGITDGTAAANKAVVLDGSKNIATLGTVGCGAITSTGNSTFGRVQLDSANDYIDVDTDLKLIAAADIVLDPGGSDVKVDGNVVPNGDDGGTLGSANLNWSDLYMADGAVINFGDDQEITLTHTADTMLSVESAVSDFVFELKATNADATAMTLAVHRSSSSPADGDDLGSVDFYGYSDGGTQTVYGSILCEIADASHGATQGKMSLKVAENDGTSTAGLILSGLSSDGDITVDVATHDGAAGGLMLAGTLVTSTAAEINLLDTSVANSVVNNKAVIYGASGQVRGSRLEIDSANDYIDVSTDLQLIAAADILLDPAGSDVKVDGNVIPNADDGGSLGSANNNWSDLFLADGAVVNFGDDQEITLTHTADTMLSIESAVSDFVFELKATNADATAMTLAINRSSSSPADGDDLGSVDFYGYSDGGAQTVYGSILAEITDASHGATQGKMSLKVAEYDGTSTAGLVLEGGSSDGIIDVTIGAGVASTTTIAGNLTVSGTTTTINSTTIAITSSFTFEGTNVDAHETTLGVIEPTADRAINLANVAGTLIPFAAASTTAISSTPGELNLLDGSAKSTSSITLADADAIIVIDGSTTKQIPASDLKTFIGSGTTTVQNIDDSGTITAGLNYFSSLGGAESCTLPASPSVGDTVWVKAPSNCSTSNKITINRAGSQTIDGETAILLESPHAAVTLIYAVSDVWVIV